MFSPIRDHEISMRSILKGFGCFCDRWQQVLLTNHLLLHLFYRENPSQSEPAGPEPSGFGGVAAALHHQAELLLLSQQNLIRQQRKVQITEPLFNERY